MRRLERAKADALVAGVDLGVESAVRAHTDAAVAGARAAAGWHLVGGRGGARESEESGGGARWAARRGASDTRWRGSEISMAVGSRGAWC
jgi:hypothetical protein